MLLPKPSSCLGCPLAGNMQGFVPAHGPISGDSNGVLVVLEAAGESEEKEGIPTCGRAGHFLWSNLKAAGIERDNFVVHNVLSCRPPKNELRGMPYEDAAISHCHANLDATIADMQQTCQTAGRHLVIVTLGRIAFKRIMGISSYKDPILKEDFLCYPFWSNKYSAWIIPVDHPSHLMQGNTRLIPVLQFGFQRALEIAEHGLTIEKNNYLLDPEPATFAGWVRDYLSYAAENESYLSYDIETPYKQGKSEDTLSREEDQDSWQILRCSFAYRPGDAVSVPWTAQFLPYIEELFQANFTKIGWNNSVYDSPRINAKVRIGGPEIDGMQCWHVLNSALDKSLGFVTPFYVHNTELWKHLSDSQPAFYNAKDADMALRNFLGIKRDLIKNGQWKVIERHIIQLNEALGYMSRKGVLLDQGMRAEAEEKLSTLLKVTDLAIESSVPEDARKLKVYKKTPKDTTGMKQIHQEYPVKYCPTCGIQNPKRWKKHATLCGNHEPTVIMEGKVVWAKPLEFKVSNQALQKYQEVLKHKAILSRKDRKITFDEGAILKLVKDYPSDPLYPEILKHREYQKLLSTYVGVTEHGIIVGGMPTKEDGRIHTIFQHNPSTLRLASSDPNMQNIPRAKSDLSAMIRNMLVAAPGHSLTATDFSGIEAVLVGFFAMAKEYIRLARIDIHSFYTAYALNHLDGRVHSSDLPLLSWDDDKLSTRLAEIKAEFKPDRNNLYKHLVHAINFGQGAKGAQAKIHLETGELFQVKLISTVMDIYKELFPEIPRWQTQLLHQVHRDGYLKNPFDYIHRFNQPFKFTKVGTQWEKSPGSDANAIWAFLPQSTAAGIMKEALLRLYFERFEEAGQYLRLTVHDELLSEVPEEFVDQELRVKQEEMGKPIPQLPLPASYGMGSHLSIGVESKLGHAWGGMKGYHG